MSGLSHRKAELAKMESGHLKGKQRIADSNRKTGLWRQGRKTWMAVMTAERGSQMRAAIPEVAA